MSAVTLQPADRIGSLKPYAPPIRVQQSALILDNNEGAPIEPIVFDALKALTSDDLSRYPNQSGLEASIADSFGVPAQRVVITNGGDDAIDRVCRAVLNPGEEMITHTPGFVMIPRYAQLAGAVVKPIPWLTGSFPVSAVLQSINPRTKLVALVSPNNPTGQVIESEVIREIARGASRVGAFVLLDQAYVEFADDDPIGHCVGLDNLIVVRTFSKALGLAGARVGYALAPKRIAGWLRTVGGPYPVSSLSLALASTAWGHRTDRRLIIEQTKRNRTELIDSLRAQGLEPLDSQGNFVFVRFADAQLVYACLRAQGISVRRFRQGAEIDSYLRITVPADPDQLQLLTRALQSALQGLEEEAR
jgi:histidinol-phosphate aminotransferase